MKELVFSDRVQLDIYLIGYSIQGESIIFNIVADNRIRYTGVIDSYCVKRNGKEVNYTMKLLDFLDIDRIDALFWIHPHDDHTKGFEKLFSKLDKRSSFFVPQEIKSYDDNTNICASIFNFIEHESDARRWTKNRKDKEYKPIGCQICPISSNTVVRNKPFDYLKSGLTKYIFDINVFSPHADDLFGISWGGPKKKENEYSIGLWLTIGELSVLFTGDITSSIISKIDRNNFPEYVDYIKIPHHGSSEAISFAKLFKGKPKVNSSCTTVYKNSGLPKEEVISKYRKISKHVISTNGAKEEMYQYGIVKVSIDFTDEEFIFTHKCIGDAGFI